VADKAKSPTTLGEDQHGVGRSHIKKAALKRDQWQFMVGSLWDKEEQKMMTEWRLG